MKYITLGIVASFFIFTLKILYGNMLQKQILY